MPPFPQPQDISDCIARSKNSCAGPDGIPFSVWRALREHAAPVLHMVVVALTAGLLPPADFNNGLLFLIPKKGTLLPTDTRPISVTNADNRIIARQWCSPSPPSCTVWDPRECPEGLNLQARL